jgi:putative phosphoesterase
VRVAAIADIHGNLPALEATLRAVEQEAPDLIVVCGDVASGPLPVETLAVLKNLKRARFVRGNADRGLVAAFDGTEKPKLAGPAADWCAAQISADDRDFLAAFEETIWIEVGGIGQVLFCHGSPRSDEEIMTVRTAQARLDEFLAGVKADVVVCGHTHMPFDRMHRGIRVVNPGSVGMPYGETGAHWAMLGPDVAFHREGYDLEAAARLIGQSTWPEAAGFAGDNVVQVPSVDEAMAFLAAHGGP